MLVFGALLLLLVVEECLEQNVVRRNSTWHASYVVALSGLFRMKKSGIKF